MDFRPGYRGFLRFCQTVGYPLAPFQKVIARAVFGPGLEARKPLGGGFPLD